jgi:hypothetical protein
MKTLFLAWQDTSSREWFPIGKLEAQSSSGPFRFTYLRGAEKAHQTRNMPPLESFPDFHRVYEADSLFPLFKNRVVQSSREDFKEYLRQLDLDPNTTDPLTILALTEGKRQTDNLEVFPKIMKAADGGFTYRFFLHGWRHVGEAGRKRVEVLKEGDELRVAIELNNPSTGLAVQLQTIDYQNIGWAPRYLIVELVRLINENYQGISAKIVHVNHESPAVVQQKILVELSGVWPEGFEPMSDRDFESIGDAAQAPFM